MMNIIEPTLLLDVAKCKRNISNMVLKAKRNNIRLRPHFKTHQSKAIGQWFAEMGVSAITVSSLKMACYFAEAGWNDITVAFPVNILEIDRINRLAKRIHLNLLVEDSGSVAKLDELLEYSVNVFIKVDLGLNRTGVDSFDDNTLDSVINAIKEAEHISFKGFLSHAGNSYNCRSNEEIKKVHNESLLILRRLYDKYIVEYPNLDISPGDTPTCSICEDFSPATEIRPGNFVFYDLTQRLITSATVEDIAVAMACPVVAKHKNRNEIILYGGGIHFSKEFIDHGNGKRCYGELVSKLDSGWGNVIEGCYVSKLSQEHGTLKVTDKVFEQTEIGDVLLILPVHSCMTANLMRNYLTLDGKQLDYFDSTLEYFVG